MFQANCLKVKVMLYMFDSQGVIHYEFILKKPYINKIMYKDMSAIYKTL
jgi:hypothetical protein